MSSWKKIGRTIKKMVSKPLAYPLDMLGNAVGADDLSKKITQATSDKWLAPENKDAAEKLLMAIYAGSQFGGTDMGETDSLGRSGGGMDMGGLNNIGSFLSQVPGDVGEFFKSGVGNTITSFFTQAGGNVGKIGSLLDRLGITGAKKDMIEEMLTIAALTELGQVTAKDAIETAKQYEAQQKQLTQSLVADAQRLNDPKYVETSVQKAQADINQQYASARTMEQQNLYARGLGDRMPGRLGAITADQAVANAKARQDIELAAPLNGMQATNMALGVVSNAAQYSRTRADEQAALPVNTYLSLKAANANSPSDDYYRAELERLKREDANQGGNPAPSSIPTYGPPAPAIPGAVSADNPTSVPGTFITGWSNMYPPANNYNENVVIPAPVVAPTYTPAPAAPMIQPTNYFDYRQPNPPNFSGRVVGGTKNYSGLATLPLKSQYA